MGVVDYNSVGTPPDTGEDELSTQFDTSIALVRDHTNRFEQDYARPALKICYAYSKAHPISALFLAFFASLSAIPVLTFLCLSVFIAAILTATALGVAFIAAAGVILSLLAGLCCILIGTFFSSLFLSIATLFTYIIVRFAMLVRKDGTSGVASWTSEMKHLVVGAKEQGHQQAIRGRQTGVKVPPQSEDTKMTEPGFAAQDDPATHMRAEDIQPKAADRFYNDYGVKEQGE